MDLNMTNYVHIVELPYVGAIIVQHPNGMMETFDVDFADVIYREPTRFGTVPKESVRNTPW